MATSEDVEPDEDAPKGKRARTEEKEDSAPAPAPAPLSFSTGMSFGGFASLSGSSNPFAVGVAAACLLYTSPSPRDGLLSRMPSSA